MTPPFLTASFKSASAAVVPCVPQTETPICSRMRATLSPAAGVGARDRSTIPKGTFRRRDASSATSCPMRVIWKAVFLIVSATSSNGASAGSFSSACLTTPGPLTPTLMTHSPSPVPWNAPAMKGLSSTALANTTSLAQPNPPASAVSAAVFLMTCPISATASMLIPARVEPTLTLEQTLRVAASASGMDSIKLRSARVMPL